MSASQLCFVVGLVSSVGGGIVGAAIYIGFDHWRYQRLLRKLTKGVEDDAAP